MSANIIIRASAGSGKTYQLTNRYLDLAYRGAPLDAVLASTFTRKAAGEILDRILRRLSEAARDEKARREVSELLYGRDGKQIGETEAIAILTETIHRLHRLRIGTLDAFFIQIAGSFSLELGIPPGWSIVEELDDRRHLGEAIRKVFSRTQTSDAVRMTQLLFKGEAKRSITHEVFDLASNLLQLYRTAPGNAWKTLQKLTPLSRDELAETRRRFENVVLPPNKHFAAARTKALSRIADENWGDFLKDGFAPKILDKSYVFSRRPLEGELLEILETLVAHAKAEVVNRLAIQTEATGELLERISEEYERVKEENRVLRFDDVTFRLGDGRLRQHLAQIVHRIDTPTQHMLLDEFQDTSPIQWDVLRPFVEDVVSPALKKIRQQASDGSFFCVGDAKQAIYGWRGGVAEIFDMIEKEITPLETRQLNESWRSAPAVIETVNALFGNLDRNPALRDAPYDRAAGNWQERFERHSTAKGRYEGYCTIEVAPLYDSENLERLDPELWNMMELARGTGDEEDESENEEPSQSPSAQNPLQKELNLQFAVRRIAQLHRENPWASLGVLTRTNRMVGRLIRDLKRIGIAASEEGGNPLTDSPAVETILSALLLADHPGDTIRRFHLAGGPLAGTLGITDAKNDRQALRASHRIRRSLLQKGYGAVLSEWARQLAPSCDRRNLDRLLQLLQLAYAWDDRFSVRADRFVEMVRTTRVESPSGSKIRVMNIHQSKGLQFDIVVLPELQGKLVGSPSKVLVGRRENSRDHRSEPTAPIQRIVRWPNATERALLPEVYRRMHRDDQIAKVEESLCVLYVAMTRAIHRLCMIVPPHGKPKQDGTFTVSKTFDAVLRWGLPENGAPGLPGTVLYENGQPRWFENPGSPTAMRPDTLSDGTQTDRTQTDRTQTVCAIRLNTNVPQTRNLQRISPSQLEGTTPTGMRPPRRLHDPNRDRDREHRTSASAPPETLAEKATEDRKKRRAGMLWGTAMHACFEKGLARTPWLDEAEPDTSDLHRVVTEVLSAARTDHHRPQNHRENLLPHEVVAAFRETCEKPTVRETLSRSCYRRLRPSATEVQWDVFAERRFVLRVEQGIVRGAIDRLVLVSENGVAVEAEITDFKTDVFLPERDEDLETFLDGKTAFYAPQLHAYRDAAARLYRLDPRNIRVQLLFTSVDRVRVVQ